MKTTSRTTLYCREKLAFSCMVLVGCRFGIGGAPLAASAPNRDPVGLSQWETGSIPVGERGCSRGHALLLFAARRPREKQPTKNLWKSRPAMGRTYRQLTSSLVPDC